MKQDITDTKIDEDIILAAKRIKKTESIIWAALLIIESCKKYRKDFEELATKIEQLAYVTVEDFYKNKSQYQYRIKDNLCNMVFYINILKLKGYITEDNHSALVFAYSAVIKAYDTLEKEESRSLRDIDLGLQDTETKDGDSTRRESRPAIAETRDMDKNLSLKDTRKQSQIRDKATAPQPVKSSQTGQSVSDNKNLKEVIFVKRQDSRRNEILDMLSTHPINIKDIAQKVLGCSEKTIQRELNSLLEDKLIERIGEKRWSKYVIV